MKLKMLNYTYSLKMLVACVSEKKQVSSCEKELNLNTKKINWFNSK